MGPAPRRWTLGGGAVIVRAWRAHRRLGAAQGRMRHRLERIQNEWNRSEFASPRPRAVAYATRACVAIERCLPLPVKGKLKMLY